MRDVDGGVFCVVGCVRIVDGVKRVENVFGQPESLEPVYRSGGQWKMLQSSSSLMMTILPRRLWSVLQLGFRIRLKMLSQASIVAPRRSQSNPPIIPSVLDNILFSLHPNLPLVVPFAQRTRLAASQRRKPQVLSYHSG